MKQITVAILTCLLVLAFMACRNENTQNNKDGGDASQQIQSDGGANDEDAQALAANAERMTDNNDANDTEVSSEAEQNGDANETDAICGYPTADKWGVYLSAKDITPEGLTLVCRQSGGDAEGELQTGSYYRIEYYESKSDEWIELSHGIENLAWTAEAWGIPKQQTVEWEVDWSFLYGSLKPGYYRIVKEIMDFKGTGNFEETEYTAAFEISENVE